VQKVLAGAGHGSRRKIEGWIREGRLAIDGRTAKLGDTVRGDERITLDGRQLEVRAVPPSHRYIIYNKPEGEIVARSDPEGRDTVFEKLPKLKGARWVAVGRLDVATTGLIIHGEPSAGDLAALKQGVDLDDGPAQFESIEASGGEGRNKWFKVSLREGRYREVRRLWEARGFEVSRLIRIGYGPLDLPRKLRRGKYEALTPAQVRSLYVSTGLKPPGEVRRVHRHKKQRKNR
jgi:23S rRNA pseudouridine2605 synthase